MRVPVIALFLFGALARAADTPLVVGQARLPALPVELSAGPAGPVNQIAIDLQPAAAHEPPPQVLCVFPGDFRYRCSVAPDPSPTAPGRRRFVVSVPDLGRGHAVVLEVVTARARQELRVEIANRPQVIHEIEALVLPGGGQTATGADGRPAPLLTLASVRATATPAIATSRFAAAPACDRIHAEWVGTSATDSVFISPFGPLQGTIAPSRPVTPGSRVHAGNVPEWLVTFPQSATRVQFIAHYEVVYRVGPCPQRIIAAPS